jgi:hypothetical protein
MKNISEYNWNWWFVLTVLIGSIGVVMQMSPANDTQQIIANWMVGISVVSILPCIYVGMKPLK